MGIARCMGDRAGYLIIEAQPLPARLKRAAVAALVDAFWDYPESVHLLPDEARRARVLPRYLAGDCAVASRHGTLYGVIEGGRVLGAAAWLPPSAYPMSWIDQAVQGVA